MPRVCPRVCRQTTHTAHTLPLRPKCWRSVKVGSNVKSPYGSSVPRTVPLGYPWVVVERGSSRDASPERGASFGERLRRLREAAGLTQEELASRAGLSTHAVGVLERGERKRPYPHTIRSLADALELDESERTSLFAAVPRRGAPPPAAPATALELSLPTPPTTLLGREQELEEIRTYLREVRLLTLTGTGGVGKTRLALEAARQAAELFPDGVAFVALAPLGDPALVVPTLARSLELREEGQTPREVLRAHLQDKQLLLVLDNFEHLLGAAADVTEIIESCARLVVLVTSRAPLRVRGEQDYPVPPLALPASTLSANMEEVLESPSGKLFVERAKAVSPAFSLTQANAAMVAAICWRLAGLPLALELAAAKVRFLDPATLLARLDRALSTGWERDLPDRQRTMQATLDWSHELLSEPEKALFKRLSVFAGGFTLEAAEAVGKAEEMSVEDVLNLLERLVEQSLVTVKPDGSSDGMRYGMLEPVRQYALEKLEASGEAEEARRRHAAYFLELSERAAPELTRSEQGAWLERLEREHDNLRTIFGWLLERGNADGAAYLGWDLMWFWCVRGHLAEGVRWMERTLAHEDSVTPSSRARALAVISALASPQGDLDRAALAEESGLLARQIGDREVLALATYMEGHVAFIRGEHARALVLAEESVALYRDLGDLSGAGLALTVPACVALTEADFARFERLLDESEELLRAAESWWSLTVNITLRTNATALRDDHAQTISLLRESLSLASRLRDTQTIVYGLEGVAGALAMLGRGHRAARLFGAAEALRERTGSTATVPPWRELHERHLEALRTRLDAEELAAAWAEGRSMTSEQAVAYALEGEEANKGGKSEQ
jgi:predicted ATPase/DNA-binding XRE family transcriptional regulator